ncbi:rhodanese-like domain-containing protein [Aurantibacter sp.]|uniref:rhodanese-like domain-containing protein n=1 Tax=Aurantibacter sp. TaxID=2807103 RepID=UPI003264FEC3
MKHILNKALIILFILSTVFTAFGQTKIDRTLRQLNKESVPYTYVENLEDTNNIILLDTREKVEFNVSHLENAIWVGYKNFEIDSIKHRIPDTDSEVVVYCSIGVRSEDIGEKLKKAGYSNVKNLYGGIFEWKNKGNIVYDTLGTKTERVHAFNKQWGKLLTAGEKVYDKKKNKR